MIWYGCQGLKGQRVKAGQGDFGEGVRKEVKVPKRTYKWKISGMKQEKWKDGTEWSHEEKIEVLKEKKEKVKWKK